MKPVLRTVTRSQGNNRRLKEGAVTLPDFSLEFEEVAPLPRAFRRMVREGAYDISEMALTTYLCARAHGAALTGVPVFLVRGFHHGAIVQNRAAGIAGPKDLEGRRVGVARGYTVTTGVWARAILEEEHGLDLSRVTWARSDEEHVTAWTPPGNVEMLGGAGSLEEQLSRGEIGAAVGTTYTDESVAPMIERPFEAGLAALKRNGLYPINHLVVIRDDVARAHPDLPRQLFDAFAASKRAYVEELKAGRVGEPTAADRTHLAALEVLNDPLPYGVAPNLHTLERLMDHALRQRILSAPLAMEDLFHPSVLDCAG